MGFHWKRFTAALVCYVAVLTLGYSAFYNEGYFDSRRKLKTDSQHDRDDIFDSPKSE